MRLRQLASLQSVVFFAPPEVNQSILDLRRKMSSVQIDSRDVYVLSEILQLTLICTNL